MPEQRGHDPTFRRALPDGRIALIVPTFRRDEALARSLRGFADQTFPPQEVVVVDNANSASCRATCDQLRRQLPFQITYLPSVENGGPAGATKLGMEELLPRLDDTDWIARGDDDSPDVDTLHFERLIRAATGADLARLGAIGGSGSRYDHRTGFLWKPPPDPSGLTPVDYVATNFLPLFSVAAVREVGGFREELFFGHDEVEYGLRLRRAGYELLRIDGPDLVRLPTRRKASLDHPTWRRFYSVRNGIVVAREYGSRSAALRLAVIAVAKPLVNLPLSPRNAMAHLRLAGRAVFDAYRGRLGRTLEPSLVDGRLDERIW